VEDEMLNILISILHSQTRKTDERVTASEITTLPPWQVGPGPSCATCEKTGGRLMSCVSLNLHNYQKKTDAKVTAERTQHFFC
jgi:hypothetical protein